MIKFTFGQIKYPAAALFVGLVLFTYFNFTGKSDVVWVERNPIKCLGNAWEFDWFRANPGQYNNYPKGVIDRIDEKEIEILKNYYKEEGVNIIEVRSRSFVELGDSSLKSCEICSCPQGYTLYLQISTAESKKMLELGWELSNVKF